MRRTELISKLWNSDPFPDDLETDDSSLRWLREKAIWVLETYLKFIYFSHCRRTRTESCSDLLFHRGTGNVLGLIWNPCFCSRHACLISNSMNLGMPLYWVLKLNVRPKNFEGIQSKGIVVSARQWKSIYGQDWVWAWLNLQDNAS